MQFIYAAVGFSFKGNNSRIPTSINTSIQYGAPLVADQFEMVHGKFYNVHSIIIIFLNIIYCTKTKYFNLISSADTYYSLTHYKAEHFTSKYSYHCFKQHHNCYIFHIHRDRFTDTSSDENYSI